MISWFCPRCWASVSESTTVCPGCGADLSSLDRASYDEKLTRALWHPDGETARRAASLLGARRDTVAVGALIDRYHARPDPYLAADIVRALRQIDSAEAVVALKEIARSAPVLVRRALAEALPRP